MALKEYKINSTKSPSVLYLSHFIKKIASSEKFNNWGSSAYEKLHNSSGKSIWQKFQSWTTVEFESPEISLNKISERKIKYSKGLFLLGMIHAGKQLTFKLIRPSTMPDKLGHDSAEGRLWVADPDAPIYFCYYPNKKGRWA